MEIHLSSELVELLPNIKIAIIEYRNITVGDSPQMVKGRLQLFQESIYFDLENKNITDLPGIQEWRKVFKITGKDPNRYRHSAEALMRRVQKQNYLSSVQSAIDINNFFSLQYQVPIGIYDQDLLSEPVSIRIGHDGEEYLGLNGRVNSLERLIIASDQKGPFGSPFVDSERTPVTKKTKNALQMIYLRPSTDMVIAEKLTESLMNMFTQIHGGEASFQILGCQ
ncbi:B3/B4 domain-containing protein [Neobacillus ginsengisoli]|uniref:DNA/RNA-binding domain of Phe-tRNA-synthetase-like protein n=1 Tax=Neobacillus ginsengisoli TaxID=904295 RepID=A0ABT9XQV5_9BACI|nr:phenylalanine--tRNA ligase beta subunit-related protein [Neobacillus ginsengisoli]MDQ0197935.1 DNA/RNA-binding domain of Phe-tRNA-synthetase-like protein [Neobacillus ginsengisoli]